MTGYLDMARAADWGRYTDQLEGTLATAHDAVCRLVRCGEVSSPTNVARYLRAARPGEEGEWNSRHAGRILAHLTWLGYVRCVGHYIAPDSSAQAIFYPSTPNREQQRRAAEQGKHQGSEFREECLLWCAVDNVGARVSPFFSGREEAQWYVDHAYCAHPPARVARVRCTWREET